jgi:hypothetical protein
MIKLLFFVKRQVLKMILYLVPIKDKTFSHKLKTQVCGKI